MRDTLKDRYDQITHAVKRAEEALERINMNKDCIINIQLKYVDGVKRVSSDIYDLELNL